MNENGNKFIFPVQITPANKIKRGLISELIEDRVALSSLVWHASRKGLCPQIIESKNFQRQPEMR